MEVFVRLIVDIAFVIVGIFAAYCIGKNSRHRVKITVKPEVKEVDDNRKSKAVDESSSEEKSTERLHGRVRWFKGGIGFISGTPDVFIHHKNIDMPGYRNLHAGQMVSYEQVRGDRGLVAIRIRPEPLDQTCPRR